MKVFIEKVADGTFMVGMDTEAEAQGQAVAQGGANGAPMAQAPAEQENGQPAPNLQAALMMAAKLLSQPDTSGATSPFDEGMQKTMPNMPR